MKRNLFVFLILFSFINLKAQHPDKIIIFLITDFENNNPYPPNNLSSFQFLFVKPEWAKDRCISYLQLFFNNKFDTDTLCDGGYIEISYDNGITWNNIINENYSDDQFFQDFYTLNDTIIGGIPSFTGNTYNKWYESGVILFWNDEKALKLDSVSIRFNFKSDNSENNRDGWIIDNIHYLIEDYCTIGIDEFKKDSKTFIYPNPVKNISILELPDTDIDYQVRIFNIQGIEVFSCITQKSIEINKNDFKTGIYVYKICNSKNQTYTGKFIVK